MAMPTKRNEAVAAGNGRDDAEMQAHFSIESSSPACGLHVAASQGAALHFLEKGAVHRRRC
jgi:hypothetical protein